MIIGLFAAYFAICISMLVWGLRYRDRVLQFPFLAGSVWVFYVGIQAIGVAVNPEWVPVGARRDGGLEMALLMASLCAGLSFWGYLRPMRLPGSARRSRYTVYSYRRLFVGGCVLIAIAYLSFFKLAELSGGVQAHFSTEGNYQLEWRGLPVAYVFFNRMIYPGLSLVLLAALHKPNLVRIVGVSIGSLLPLANILILGRRTEGVFLLLTVALCLFFQRRWAPRRSVAVIAVALGGIMVIVMPAYRAHSTIGSDYGQILAIDLDDLILSQVTGKTPSEFTYPVVQLAATHNAFEFNLGMGFYNRLIKEWVPSLLVGREFKDSLFVEGPDFRQQTLTRYSWQPQFGWIPLGITDAFREFWFFGSFVFYLLGRGFRYLWERAYSGCDLRFRVFYIALISEAMLTILHGVTPFPFFVIYAALALVPILMFGRIRRPGKLPVFSGISGRAWDYRGNAATAEQHSTFPQL